MGLFGFGNNKKEEAPQQPRVPVDEVIRMRRQGLSNNQIVQSLQRNGYPAHQIFDALHQADLRVPSAVRGMPGPVAGQQRQQPRMQADSPESLGMPPGIPPAGMENEAAITGPQGPEDLEDLPSFGDEGGFGEQQPEAGSAMQGNVGGRGDVSSKIEEISESIIEEKWQDLMKDFNKLTEWKTNVEQRMAVIEQRFADLKTAFDNLQKSVIDKVSDYDKSVKDVGTEMKALEQVFQKIIPTLSENVNELSRITKGMKTSAPSKK